MASITEQIMTFLNDGYGKGDGSGYGYGKGGGCCYGDGSGHGYGKGSGYVYDDGYGYGCGYGNGHCYGFDYGFAEGSGHGDGNCAGIKSLNNKDIYMVDGMPTIIAVSYDNYAKGFIVGNDFALKRCYIAKNGDIFAHGKTLREAVAALQNKLFEDMPEEKRIAAFI